MASGALVWQIFGMCLHVLLIVALGFIHVAAFNARETKTAVMMLLVNLVGFLGCKGALAALTAKELGLVHTTHMLGQFKSECEAFVAFTACVRILSSVGNFMLPEALAAVCHIRALAAMQLFHQCHSRIVIFSQHAGMHEHHVLLKSLLFQELFRAVAAAILEVSCMNTFDML